MLGSSCFVRESRTVVSAAYMDASRLVRTECLVKLQSRPGRCPCTLGFPLLCMLPCHTALPPFHAPWPACAGTGDADRTCTSPGEPSSITLQNMPPATWYHMYMPASRPICVIALPAHRNNCRVDYVFQTSRQLSWTGADEHVGWSLDGRWGRRGGLGRPAWDDSVDTDDQLAPVCDNLACTAGVDLKPLSPKLQQRHVRMSALAVCI